ncbi:UDP-2-acetamido-2-deoxy-3-oxo-D-glucuronate aminotransferase [Oxobacter pfennigii]|uniref:UDP-2-acetamido-2-deoxy-3-oxo-D-glucuronate aminotransferase n=1 Tax=Oxobacter pfennigii TaxID=36849 RepID=A0A0P9AI42_9CLOT|nr:DegT/DnrJ/EryC1/StrS family aminotransferase [Oxobacter pfennigii]KPU45125.1 UDP-2-acetamido-2-deoxy-3-oxo-D-glucuronate aminotransferase [Oxobacter pfennigii]
MKVNFYTSQREYQEKKAEFDKAIENVLKDGISTLGKEVADLEKSIMEFTSAKYAVGVASGTDALVLASDILGFKNGSEVITSPFTFLASTSCIARHGGQPVFVDIDEETFNIDAAKIEDAVTDKTVGIVPIHLFCQMADMDSIMDIAARHNLKVLEDAAEAFGMSWKGKGSKYKHAGTIGDYGIYSFFPTKTLGAYGDGGMIVTNDEGLYKLAKSYRVHGATEKYHYDYIGYNSRLDTIQAAILLVKMKYMREAITKREVIANWYFDRLKDCQGLRFPKIKGEQHPVYYVFNILAENRDGLVEHLKKNQVQYSIYYPLPLHLQKCFSYLGYKKGDFPVSERVCTEIAALPIYPEITEDEVDFVCHTIRNFYK